MNALSEPPAATAPGIGRPPRGRREALRKLVWIGIWLAFMSAPVHDLLDGPHSAAGRICGWLGLVLFVGAYLVLVFRHTGHPLERRLVGSGLAFLTLGATALALGLGAPWLVLFVYVSVAVGSTLPLPLARWLIPLTTLYMVLLGLPLGQGLDLGLVVPALLGGFALTGVRQLIRTTVELSEARATVAQLAASEERLRLARDLHDLLGHSLSLITLKSELAGRMLPAHPEGAAKEVADIQRVGRQALADVREAVTGYRRPRLAAELALVQGTLRAAGITATMPPEPPPEGLPEEAEAALAWVLREAVTNVVRHSGARHCTVELLRRETLDGPRAELTVRDDGEGATTAPFPAPDTTAPGNGLTGLRERLDAVGGTLAAGPGKGRGFRVVARVPMGD
ncbi:sensor histidine kinase [Streptomyces physcomitrii]|uniref:sensor histidine kinase n=1 Tax=Streptomyces physcomitrii TaxID=2724184 RepID=UPI0033E37DEB